MNILLNFALPFLISFPALAAPSVSGTVVQSTKVAELRLLRSALTQLSGESCGAITENDGVFNLETSPCLPKSVRHLVGKFPSVYGPNCYNFANILVGVQSFVRPVSDIEGGLVTEPALGYCRKVKRSPKAGDYVRVVAAGEETDPHAYVYLTETFAFTKNGADASEPWKIGRVSEIRTLFMESVDHPGQLDPSIGLAYYECGPRAVSKTAVLRILKGPADDLARALEAVHTERRITLAAVRRMSRAFETLRRTYNETAITAVNRNMDKGDPNDSVVLLVDVYANLGTFNYVATEKGLDPFASAAARREFIQLRSGYQRFILHLAKRTYSEDLIGSTLR